MSTIYDLLAPFYDELNGELDYESWADFWFRFLTLPKFPCVRCWISGAAQAQ